MSVDRNYYAIVGYDITGCLTEKYEDWQYTDVGEEYCLNHVKDNIQIFDDPMCGNHVYFGYVLGNGDQFEFDPIEFDVYTICELQERVRDELMKLIELGIVDVDINYIPLYKVIVFEECS